MEKRDRKKWTITIPVGEWNYDIIVEATPEGLEIEYEVIPWEDIDLARNELWRDIQVKIMDDRAGRG